MAERKKSHRAFRMPNSYVVIFCMILICAVLTWIVPAGQYDTVLDRAGRSLIVDGSYHRVAASPVGILGVFSAIEQGFIEVANIIFFILYAYGFVHMLIKNGTFDAMIGSLLRKSEKFNVQIVFAIIMAFFGILGSTMGMSEETYGMYPVFIGIATALGYDAIVGASIVYIGVRIGFASSTLNPFTIGVANQVAQITMTKEMLIYRTIILVVMETIGIIYVWRYSTKIKNDPTKSLLYSTEYADMGDGKTKEELMATHMNKRHIMCFLVFLRTMAVMIWGVIAKGWYIDELSTLFLIAMVSRGIVGGFGPGEIVENFLEGSRSMLFGALICGLSRAILIVLKQGMIIDTILYAASGAMKNVPTSLAGIFMVLTQTVMNMFIPSGSGQAAATMPIMAPLADLLGISRQVACLAFSFGDGYSNMIIPTGLAMTAGLMGLPIDKWFKWISKLFLIMLAMEFLFISIAVGIGL
jgi:uncharacterized ion transporter superfamily protein YfcC